MQKSRLKGLWSHYGCYCAHGPECFVEVVDSAFHAGVCVSAHLSQLSHMISICFAQATGAAPPVTLVTVLLGHLPWHQPMAFSCSAQILELMPVIPRQLLGVVNAWPTLRIIKALLPGIKLSTLLGLFSYTFVSGGRFRGRQIPESSLMKIQRMVEVGRNLWN